MNKQQTAVEWLVEQVEQISNNKNLSKQESINLYNKAIEQAKALDKPKYTNQKLWEMAKVITDKQKAATEIDLSKVDWNMLEESWYDWLEEELIKNK